MFVILLQSFSNSYHIFFFLYLRSLYLGSLKVDFIIFDENPILDLIIFCGSQFQSDPIEFLLQDADVLLHAEHFPFVVFNIVVGDFDHPLSIIILISPPQLYINDTDHHRHAKYSFCILADSDIYEERQASTSA